jgi:hypothetical protein
MAKEYQAATEHHRGKALDIGDPPPWTISAHYGRRVCGSLGEPRTGLRVRDCGRGASIIISFRSTASGVAAMFTTMVFFLIPVLLMLCGIANSLWATSSGTDGFG